ncbi:hypothetical protein BRD00_11830 [Halobacteriales archaeon QS_8_69_26]|nr:MAG: hypothetical protein BRD00_11830 [Halobacteriales archaeon QS_8_69_26]
MSMIATYEEFVAEECYGLTSEVTDEYTVSNPTPGAIYNAVMLHHYVRTEFDDQPRDHAVEPLQTFSETWHREEGNCEELSVLLCSLLRQVPDHRTRFVTVDNDECQGHALLQINFTGVDDPERVARLLRIAHKYIEEIDRSTDEIHWETEGDDHWFVADPIKSEYIGDVARHVDEGYVHTDGGAWQWHRVKDRGNGIGREAPPPAELARRHG